MSESIIWHCSQKSDLQIIPEHFLCVFCVKMTEILAFTFTWRQINLYLKVWEIVSLNPNIGAFVASAPSEWAWGRDWYCSCINMTLKLDRLSVMRHHLIRSQIIQIALSSTLWKKQNPSCQVRKLGKASHFLRPTTSTLSSITFHCSSLDVKNLALHNVRPIKLLRSSWLGQYDFLQLHLWNCNLNLLSFLALWLAAHFWRSGLSGGVDVGRCGIREMDEARSGDMIVFHSSHRNKV